MTTTTTHNNGQQHEAADQPTQIFAPWGLPHTVTPRFGARFIQEHHRLHFLSDRASLVGEWAEEAIDRLEANFSEIIKALETDLLTGKLNAQHQQCTTIQHCGFTCEADSLGSHGYIYIVIYAVASESVTHETQASPQVLR